MTMTDQKPKTDRNDRQTIEDAEQMTYLQQWHIDHPQTEIAGLCFLLCLLIAIAATAYGVVNGRRPAPPLTARIGCRECHTPPVIHIANLKQYRRVKQRPTAADKHMLAELAENERLVNIMMGGKP